MSTHVGGELTGISLSSFLQMIEIEKHSCALKITTDGKTGCLHVNKGQLVAACAGPLRKENAAIEIINWDNVKIEIDRNAAPVEREMTVSLMAILMEALRLKDELALKKQSQEAGVEAAEEDTAEEAAADGITAESAFEQIKGLDNKTVRQELDALDLPRSSRLRMALTRIVRDAFDADELAAAIARESAIIEDQEEIALLRRLQAENRLPCMEHAVSLLRDHVDGRGD